MAIISVKERSEDRRKTNEGGNVTLYSSYVVLCDTASDGPWLALSTAAETAGLPADESEHPSDTSIPVPLVALRDTEPLDTNGAKEFLVRVTWKNFATGNDATILIADPSTQIVDYDWDGIETTETWFRDAGTSTDFDGLTGKAFVNTAHTPFDHLPVRDIVELELTISRNEKTFDPRNCYLLANRVNSDSFTITVTPFVGGVPGSPVTFSVDAGQAKTGKVSYKHLTDVAGNSYFRVSYPIKFNEKGWNTYNVESRGPFQLVSGKLQQIVTDEPGVDLSRYPLNSDGTKGSSFTATPATQTFTPYKTTAYSTLSLNSNIGF
jgi:hypothetical protein